MKREKSYGIIPLRIREGQLEILLIQHLAGHWAFPKGHADAGETPQLAAERELKEETGLTLERYLSATPLSESFHFTFQGQHIYKTVYYFIALVEGEVIHQVTEIQNSQWLGLSQALDRMTFKEGRRVCRDAIDFLSTIEIHIE